MAHVIQDRAKEVGQPQLAKLRWVNLRWMWPYVREQWKLGGIGSVGMIILSLLSLPAPFLIKIAIDEAIGGKNYQLLNMIILGMFGVQGLLFGASWVTIYSFNKFSLEIMTRIKKDLFHRVLRFPMSFFSEHQTGYLMSRVGEVEGLNLFFSSTLVNVIVSVARFIFCLGILIHLNPSLTMLALLVLPPFFIITRWFTKDMRRLSWALYEKSAMLSRGMQDSLSGIEVVKTFVAENREAEKFHARLNDIRDMNIRRTVLMSLYSESLSFLGAGAGFLILWISGGKIISGQFTLGSYLAFSAYFSQLLGPTQMIANLGMALQPAKIALQRIHELMKVVAEDEPSQGVDIAEIKGHIELRNVNFWYEADKLVFSNANMEIKAGEKVLIAGPNGAGKSTLIKLIMNFYHPQGGEILIDGKTIREISPASLRERISIVSQNTFLFSDTVRNNILYSAPMASSKELEVAVHLSGASEFVDNLPHCLDTEIGERGIRLSGGERQKLSIARAILKKSDLVIFDEATTYLDDTSVELLREMMKSRFADKTCLVISHRPIEIPSIDRAFWIENGIISEMYFRHLSVTR